MLHWTAEDTFVLNGTEFVLWRLMERSRPGRFCVAKDRENLGHYEPLIESLRPRNIVELGIYDGGSTAFLAELAQPEKLVALDISPDRCVALDDHVRARGLSVATYYGVDQADTARLSRIIGDEFDAPLDLVVDDASHLLSPTRASFDCLFPLLRPGGVYVIEDWAWAHLNLPAKFLKAAKLLPDESALSIFVYQAIMASARVPTVIAEVVVGREWTMIRRGPERCEAFDLSAACGERGRSFVEALSAS